MFEMKVLKLIFTYLLINLLISKSIGYLLDNCHQNLIDSNLNLSDSIIPKPDNGPSNDETPGFHADDFRNSSQLIQSRGFIPEEHVVTTEDGYQLRLFRCVNPKYAGVANKRIVFLQHGLLASSDIFLINSEGYLNENQIYTENGETIINDCRPDQRTTNTAARTIAFVLCDCGYDVWLGNGRGNTYTTHKTIKEWDIRFWKYTFQDQAKYDIPASFEYVLSKTSQSSLAYIGHSQGTTKMFALLTTQPKYQNMISLFIALAPVVHMDHFNPVNNILTELEPLFNHFVNRKNIVIRGLANMAYQTLKEIPFPIGGKRDKLTVLIHEYLCKFRILRSVCEFREAGPDEKQTNQSRAAVYKARSNRDSTWCVAHYCQIVADQRFEYFDDRLIPSIMGPRTAEFPLKNIRNANRIALFYGDNDVVAPVEDVKTLKKQLEASSRSKLLDDYKVPFKGWAHEDFVYGLDAGTLVNTRILELLEKTAN